MNRARRDALRLALVGVLVLASGSVAAQSQAWAARFDSGFDDLPSSGQLGRKAIAVDVAGNVYVTGSSLNGSGNADFRTVKHAPDGSVLWAVSYDGPAHGDDLAYAIALNEQGDAYVTGRSWSGPWPATGHDFRTIKYASANGAILWNVTSSGPLEADDRPNGIALDSQGNAYVTGYSFRGAVSGNDYFTIKYDSADGSVQWSATSGGLGTDDCAYAIALDGSGNAYVTGGALVDSGPSTMSDFRTIKYASADGGELWNVAFDGAANGHDVGFAVGLDAVGNAYVTGYSYSGPATGYDYRTIKYASADGGELWSVASSGPGSGRDQAVALAVDAIGDVYVTGNSTNGANTDFRTIKYASTNGSETWNVPYDATSSDYPSAIALDAQGNPQVVGSTTAGANSDYRTIKYAAATGSVLWSVAYNASNVDVGLGITSVGPVTYVTGYSRPSSSYDFLTIKYIDATPPANPMSLASTSHTPSTWTTVESIAMQWAGATDEPGGSGLAGYSVLFDTAATTVPDATIDVAHTADPHATASAALPDGTSHYFHLRTCDQAGNCAGGLHSGPYFVDHTNPGAPPSLSSPSHTPGTPSGDRTVDIGWGIASDPLSNGVASGIDGYSWFFDSSASPACDQVKDVEEGTTSATSASLANGDWFAHVCARDNAGNWSAVVNAGPYVIEDQADLSIVKADSADPVNAGTGFSYGLAVSNAGPSMAQSPTVTDILPVGVTYVSASGAGWTCGNAAGTVTCTRPSLGVGAAPVIAIDVTAPTTAATVENTASVSTTTTDPFAANNSEGESTTVNPYADLSVTMSDGAGTATPGLTTTYAIVAANAGPSSVATASVNDSFPATCSSVSWTCLAAGGATCSALGNGNILDTVSLPVGGSASYTAVCTIASSATGTLSNTAAVTSAVGDPSAVNNSATDSDTLTPSADLALTLADSPDPIPVFGSVTYAALYGNAGPSDASGTTLTLTLPTGLGFVSSEPGTPTCTATGGAVNCALGVVVAGANGTVTITATAAAGTLGTVTVDAGVTAAQSDPATGNNADSESTLVKFVKGDLQNDLATDLFLGNTITHENRIWLMNGVTQASEQSFNPSTPSSATQQVAAVDDFDQDHRNDLVFWNTATGAVEFWLMNGVNRLGAPVPLSGGPTLAPNWKPSASADFNADGQPDIVWRNSTSQKIVIWTMNGTAKAGTLIPTPDHAVDGNWEIVGAFDMNGDGYTDFLWYNFSSGKIVYWWMNAAVQRITGSFTNPANAGDNNWKVLAAGDYGVGPGGVAGTADVVWRNANSGRYVVWYLDLSGSRTSGTFTTPSQPASSPTDWTIVGPR